MDWYRITFTKDEVAEGQQQVVQAQISQCIVSAGAPPEAALFRTPGGAIPTTYYLSPRATELAASVVSQRGGEPCEQPCPGNLLLLVGVHNATGRLFGK